MKNYTISTDNCSDYRKGFMENNGIYYIPLKRILGEKIFAEVYDTDKEFEDFYAELKKGARPTTSQINPDEFILHFNKILAEQPKGDIIHVSLSGGLSGSHNSAVFAAQELNKTLKGRKIYAFDSLSATAGQALLLDKLIQMQDNTTAEKAVALCEKVRDNIHVFFMVDDLFNLKRGGRLSGVKAVLGTILSVKPILCLNDTGKLAIQTKIRGDKKSLHYLADRLKHHAVETRQDFSGETLYLVRSTHSKLYDEFKIIVEARYPKANIKEFTLGPVIGTHVGSGAVAVIFEGDKRLTIE